MEIIGELIDELFHTHRKPNGREYTHKEVCEELGNLTPSHLSKLRNGQVPNPGRDVLLSLCQFFKVPASYFFPELDIHNPRIPGSEDIIEIITRSPNISPATKKKLSEVLHAAIDEMFDQEKNDE